MINKPFSHPPAALCQPLAAELIPQPVRHWLLVQLSLAITAWAVILLGISCFV